MKQLKDLTSDPQKRPKVIEDCVKLIHDEVQSKKGLTGVAVKAAFKIVLALKPSILEESVDSLLDDFVGRLQPYYESFQKDAGAGSLERYLAARASDVAESLLGITDERAKRAKNKTLVKAYNSLRPKGKVHVEEAAPGIGRVLDRQVVSL